MSFFLQYFNHFLGSENYSLHITHTQEIKLCKFSLSIIFGEKPLKHIKIRLPNVKHAVLLQIIMNTTDNSTALTEREGESKVVCTLKKCLMKASCMAQQ